MRRRLQVDPNGVAVLGIGEDERPGQRSLHASAIESRSAVGRAAAFRHDPAGGDDFESHVMAVVPLGDSGFHVVLEQPVDVALALPMKLRRELLLWSGAGFLATLLVAWVTTRHVVKPTEELTAAAQRMAQGDLDSPIEVAAQDEVGRLAESLEVMRRQLREAYESVERNNRELESRVQDRTARLGDLLRKVISAQEDERHRLARELHDETAQTLGALSIALDRARDSLPDASPRALEHLALARGIAATLLEETRRLILDLRPMVLDDMGLTPAIRWYSEAHLGVQDIETAIEVDGSPPRLPPHIEVSLFRVVQEAVNNVAKHAEAHRVTIRLAFGDSTARIVISDDGKGFDAEELLREGSLVESVGLTGMRERVTLLGGQIHIRSQTGAGTEIEVEVPLAEGAA